MRKKLLTTIILLVMACFVLGGCNDDNKANAANNGKSEIANSLNSQERMSEEDIESWIFNNYTAPTTTTDEIDNITSRIDEETFFNVWKEGLKAPIENALGNESYTNLCTLGEGYVNLYRRVWGNSSANSNLINQIGQKIDELKRENDTLSEIESKYSTTSLSSVKSGSFYVVRKLENIYTDNILGKVQKEVDSYTPKYMSEWICCGYSEYLGTVIPNEDEIFIIRSNELNPFPNRAGVYPISYEVLNETKELGDSQGFVFNAPVYQLVKVNNEGTFSDDKSLAEESKRNAERICKEIAAIIEGKDISTVTDTAQSNYTKSGDDVDNSVEDDNDYPYLEQFITAINRYSDPPEYEGKELEDYYKREYDAWINGEAYFDLNIGDNGEFSATWEEYILPNSDALELTESELVGLSAVDLTYARNEIYARHGYIFKSDELNSYFNSKSWYYPDPDYDISNISSVEKYNAELILNYQNSHGLTYKPQ